MDKKSIIGIAVVAVLFLGFAYINSKQQKEYLEKKEAYEAYMDSVARATRPAAVPAADSTAIGEAPSGATAEEAGLCLYRRAGDDDRRRCESRRDAAAGRR